MLLYTTDNAYHCVSDLLLMTILSHKASLHKMQNFEVWVEELWTNTNTLIQSHCIERRDHISKEQRPAHCINLMNIHRCWLPQLLCRSCGDNDCPATLPIIEGLWSSGNSILVQKVAHNFSLYRFEHNLKMKELSQRESIGCSFNWPCFYSAEMSLFVGCELMKL